MSYKVMFVCENMWKNLFARQYSIFAMKYFQNYGGVKSCRACYKLQLMSTKASDKKKTISLDPNMTVLELATKMNVSRNPILKILKEYGYKVNGKLNHKTVLDSDIAEYVADEFGFSVCHDVQEMQKDTKNDTYVNKHDTQTLPRPPVVTIMGHVDHGKTTLLDYLRRTSVAKHEAGGITQSIGAFPVNVPGLTESVTFVDTPGHAAFNSMRARGAQLTDIVVLVIGADDGIMEQTIECLKHIKAAKVPMIIAINKMDKPNANPKKIKNELMEIGIQLEEFGGHIKCVNISALKGTNIDELLLLLNNFSREGKCLTSNKSEVEAIVLEAESNKQKGVVSSILVKSGKLTKGKVLIAGNAFAKVRQILDANGKVVKHAGPSDPVQILGWRSIPTPGDVAVEVENEAEARNILKIQAQALKPEKVVDRTPLQRNPNKLIITEARKGGRNKRLPMRIKLRQEAATGIKEEDVQKSLEVVVKADLSGSLEAVVNALNTYHGEEVPLNILHAGTGPVNPTDLQMASTFEGIVYGFNAGVSKDILEKASQLDVPVRDFSVIYKLTDDIKMELEGRLPFKVVETVIGEAEVLKVFHLTGARKSTVAGCRVTDGFLDNTDSTYIWKVLRNNEVIHEGSMKSLKRGTAEISSVKRLTECGVTLYKYEDFQEKDKLQCVRLENVQQKVQWEF